MKISNSIILILTCFFFYAVILDGQDTDKTTFDFKIIDKQVCRIYLEGTTGDSVKTYKGTGINVGKQLGDKILVFVITANHIVKNIINLENSFIKIYFSNSENNTLFTDKLKKENIIWQDEKTDVAIIGIPKKIHTDNPNNTDWQIQTIKTLKNGMIGQDVFMFGKRWVGRRKNFPIYKKGIISLKTREMPGYEGTLTYLVDKMSNKGMSGGLIFNDNYEAIALIIGNVLEKGRSIKLSDDLTVGISLITLNTKLDSVINQNSDNILKLLGYN